jgi:hypothetical protein
MDQPWFEMGQALQSIIFPHVSNSTVVFISLPQDE